MHEFVPAVGDDRRLPAQQDVEDNAAAPHVRFRGGCFCDGFWCREDYASEALVDDFFDSEYLGDAEVLHLDDVLAFGVEEDAGEFEVSVGNASLVAVAEQGEQLPDDWSCSILLKVLLIFEDSS